MMLGRAGGLVRVVDWFGQVVWLRALKAPFLLPPVHICGILGQKWSFCRSQASPETSTSMSRQPYGY